MSEALNNNENQINWPKRLAISLGVGAVAALAVFGAYETVTTTLENADFGPSTESILNPQGDK